MLFRSSAAQQPLDTKKLVAFMRSVKSGQDLSGLGYKSDRSKTFCKTLRKFANEHLAKLAAGKLKSPEALLGSVCGGAPHGNTMKAWFETFFAGIKLLNAAKKFCGRKPRLVIPVRFGVFWPKKAKKPQNRLG